MDEKEKAKLEAEAAKKKADADALIAAEAKKKAEDDAEILAAEAKEAAKDEEIKKLRDERDNYRAVALKRLGKLPADSEFLGEGGKEIEGLIADKVREALIDKELAAKEREKDDNLKKLTRENAELKLAIKNRPGSSIGAGGAETLEVKDNVFSAEQIASLREKAIRLKADPEKFIENAKKNFQARR